MQNEAFFNLELDGPWVVLQPACVGCIDLVGHSGIKMLLSRGGLTRESEGTYLRR